MEALAHRVGSAVTLVVADGATHHGTVTAVGPDVVTLQREADRTTLSSAEPPAAFGEGSG